jgi:hypothetical protein
MKDRPMKNIILVASMLCATGAAFAATSGTTVTTANPNLFVPAAIAYVSATVTATGAPVLAALPTTSKVINSLVCDVTDSSRNRKNANTFVSGTDIAIMASGQVSGTIATGDRVNCVVFYER